MIITHVGHYAKVIREDGIEMHKEIKIGDSFIGWGWYVKQFHLGIGISRYNFDLNLGFFWLWIEW